MSTSSPFSYLLALALILVALPSIRAFPVAGSALSALRYDYTFPNAPGSWITLGSLSPEVHGNMTFEAWIASPLPNDGQFKPIVARYPDPETLGLPDAAKGITYTNRFAEFVFQVRPDGSLNIFMGGSDSPNGSSFIYGVNINGGIRMQAFTWHHVAFTIEHQPNDTNPRAIRIFLDGVFIKGNEWSTNVQFYKRNHLENSAPIELGRYQNPAIQLFNGWMDEIRFWDVVRSEQDIANNLYTIYSGDTPNLQAYYRCNEGSGFQLNPIPYNEDSPNPYTGELSIGTFWDVSGVPSLPQWVELDQSAVALVELYGSDTLYRPTTFIISEMPTRGRLFFARNQNSVGKEITALNSSLASWYVFYQSLGEFGNGVDSFSFYVRDDSNLTSAPAVVNILLSPTVGCDGVLGSGALVDSCNVCGGNNTCVGCDGVPGSGKVFDACGVCDGGNRTCFCLDDEGNYRGFDQDELDKVLLLYKIEQSIASLESVDAQLATLYDALVAADPDELDLGDQIAAMASWSGDSCFGGFCSNLEGLFALMGVDTDGPISPPACGFTGSD